MDFQFRNAKQVDHEKQQLSNEIERLKYEENKNYWKDFYKDKYKSQKINQ